MINQPSIGTTPITEELAGRILADALPNLQEMYFRLKALQEKWQANDMWTTIDAAIAANETVAGFDANYWKDWGDALTAMLTFIDQPLEQGRPTIKQILLKNYLKS